MKSISPFFRFSGIVAAAAVALGLFAQETAAANAGAAKAVKATVLEIQGNANYSTGGAAQPLKVGTELPAGSVVNTGADSTVILDLGDSGRVSVKPESTLSIDKLNVQKVGGDTVVETELEVRKGSILGNVKKLSADSKYNVNTAKGVAGIRGTLYHIFAVGIFRCGDGQLRIVIRNLAQPGAQPQVFTVGPGQEVNNSTGAAPLVQALAQAVANTMVQEGNYVAVLRTTRQGTTGVLIRVPTEVFVSPTRSTDDSGSGKKHNPT